MDECVAVVTDLFFQSRIGAAAVAAGRRVRFLTSDSAVREAGTPSLALVDIGAELDVLAAIKSLKERGSHVVAFGPHLDTSALKEARGAGADRVVARSRFVQDLPQIIRYQRSGTAEGALGV